jgi:NhaP-type Na+/H+ or K+/H+ antiporter
VIAPVAFIALAVLVYALVSRRLSSTVVTAPIFFAAAGLLAGPVLGIVDLAEDDELLVLLLEAALVMVLFADSSGLDVRSWTKEPRLSGRLLGIGLPLTMVAGTIAAALLLGLEPWQAGLVGVILAPTDAALGQAVVANPRVPAIIRNALNVESGLNDGLALPFVTILLAAGVVAGGAESEVQAGQTLLLAIGGSEQDRYEPRSAAYRAAARRPSRSWRWPSRPTSSPTRWERADSSRSGWPG